MRKIRRKKMSFKIMIIVFVISTFTLSVGYSLLYETLSVEGIGNLILENDEEITSDYLKFTHTSNSWYSDGKYYYQIDGILENISQYTIEDWKIELQFPQSLTLQGGWNGEFSVNQNSLIITPVVYNKTINPNSSISIGFQISILSDVLNIDKIILKGSPIGTSNGDDQDIDKPTDPKDDEDIPDTPTDTDDPKEYDKIESISISTELKAEWQSGNIYISQHDFTITNSTELIVEDWIIKIKLPSNVNFSQIWGGNYINADGLLKVSGVDYNKVLQPNTSTNVLIQFESDTEGYVPEIISE